MLRVKPLFLYIIIVNSDGIELFGLASEAFGRDFVLANFILTLTSFTNIVGLKSSY